MAAMPMPPSLDLKERPFIGMVHLGALPGAPACERSLREVVERAIADALSLQEGGADAILVENFFDAPFAKQRVPAITVAAMAVAVAEVRRAVSLPIGVNVLRNDVVSAISIAHACGTAFVRCNVYVGAVVADQGIIEGAARDARKTIRELGAQVLILADVGVKHSAPIAAVRVEQEACDAVMRGRADALIVTGPSTGLPADGAELLRVKQAVPGTPVLLGSGVEVHGPEELLRQADGIIVGTATKQDGRIEAPVDIFRVRALADRWRAIRETGG
jgi:membrane complex biogenesis BtpA family protein